MPRSPYQKLKILYIMDLLLQKSDESHPVTTKQLLDDLEAHGIAAQRKAIYDDLEALRWYGLDIQKVGSGQTAGYYLASRDFELPELKLLVDSVQSSKFITHKKTASLIKKIEQLASTYDAQILQRQVYVTNRIKTMNESIYYNVDAIHSGISQNKKIQFKYFEYTVKKERRFRKDGAFYVVSPFALTWDDENYYMVAYDTASESIRHYRVDKMIAISTTDEDRDGAEVFKELDMAVYTRRVFGMFSGDEERVTMRFSNHLVGAVLDRLGQDITIVPDGEEHFTVTADVVVSPQFFAWVCGFGKDVKVIGPASITEKMKDYVREISELYE